jgi:hypothetical protein
MKTTLRTIATLVISLWSSSVRAQASAPPPPIFPTAPPGLNKIVVEDEYQFLVRQYNPSVDVKRVRRDAASYDSPEAAAIAGISAMGSGDVDWYRSTWDDASRAVLEQRDKEMKQDREFWVKAWEKAFTGRRVELTARIETGAYVMIAYRLVPDGAVAVPAKAGDAVDLVVALKLQNGKWMATQELASDPVLAYWKTPDVRPKRVVRAAPPIK